MKIYIDLEYKCHVSPAEGLREIDAPEFDGKCAEFIEGYCYIPNGEVWVNPDGIACSGVSPWKPYDQLYKAQLEYEIEQYKAALTEIETALGVTSE